LTSTSLALPFLSGLGFPLSEAVTEEANPEQIQVSNPSFSRAERDRRWAVIRRVMAKPEWNLDAILAPASGDRPSRYLTQIGGRGGSAALFSPRRFQPVHAIVGTARNRSFWEKD
jgi:hypothetical protein